MWDIKPALYDNEVKNCLVATYGIQGLAEKHDFFGYLDVYFNYDSEENYQILDLLSVTVAVGSYSSNCRSRI